ncbi:MAG: hypothetical protein IJO32_02695 [Bacilli bacterium]|nr:hypothetical protein [Bacilli bacterium]
MKHDKRIKYIKLMHQKRQKEITSDNKDSIPYITINQLERALIAYREHLKREKNVNKINVLKRNNNKYL